MRRHGVHCREPEDVVHAVIQYPAFAATPVKFLFDLSTSNDTSNRLEEAIAGYIYYTGTKINRRAQRDRLLVFLNPTDLTSR